MRKGLIDHSDSLGAAARFGRGDVQWLTAGEGIVHSEMFPLLDAEQPNPLELFQIWLNLPAEDKLVEPHFSMLWDGDIPRLRADGVEVTVIAGELAGLTPPPPPPHSWASRPEADVAIWHLALRAGCPVDDAQGDAAPTRSAPSTSSRAGAWRSTAPRSAPSTGAVVRSDVDIELEQPGRQPRSCSCRAGRIGEPVARYGPFVMNEEREIEQAFADYRETQFGGWPWPTEEPVHTHARGRFARRPDGTVEEPAPGLIADIRWQVMAPYAHAEDRHQGRRMAELDRTVWTAPVRNGVWVAARFGHR